MKLILNGSYGAENCPPKLVIAHSVVLVKRKSHHSILVGGKFPKIDFLHILFVFWFSFIYSRCQAKELERQRRLMMEGKLEKCPKELSNHPVFMVNQVTNKIVLNKRSKVNA